MKTLLNSYNAGIVLAVCVIVFYLAGSQDFFGKIINSFMPCIQNETSPFPCYGGYDIAFMIIVIIVGILCIGVLIYNFLK